MADERKADDPGQRKLRNRGFTGAAVEILVDGSGRVIFLDLPPDFVPVARALDPEALPQPVAPDTEEISETSRTRRDAKR